MTFGFNFYLQKVRTNKKYRFLKLQTCSSNTNLKAIYRNGWLEVCSLQAAIYAGVSLELE